MTLPDPKTIEPKRDFWTFRCWLIGAGALLGVALFIVLNGELNADEGFYLLASKLVRDGYRPYRDFGFTQTPLLPYANLPWLEVFGYSLQGQRLSSLAWSALTVGAGIWWLRRYSSWMPALLFVAALLGSPAWVAFAVKGKTYAFAGLWILLGTSALLGEDRIWRRWGGFVLAAGLAIGARLPAAAFFVPAGFCFLAFIPNWKRRSLAVCVALLAAVGELYLAVADSPQNFIFWTLQFHHDVQFRFELLARIRDVVAFAPGIWIAAFIAMFWLWKFRQRRAIVALGCLLGAAVINLSASSSFAEYVTPFLPALALVASPAISDWLTSNAKWGRRAVVLFAVPAGWLFPPVLTPGILGQASEAAGFLRHALPPHARVVASMAEVAVEAGATVDPLLAMGRYGVTEDFPEDVARRRRLATPVTLLELVTDPQSKAVIFSRYSDWNFSTSVPSYHAISARAQLALAARIRRDYSPAFINDAYLIYLRNDITRVP
jgi:hypothetical protein